MVFKNLISIFLLSSWINVGVWCDPEPSATVVMHVPMKEHKHTHTIFETVHHYLPIDPKMMSEAAVDIKPAEEHLSESRAVPAVASTKLFPTTGIEVHRPLAKGRYIPIKDSLAEQRPRDGARQVKALGPPRFVKRKHPKKYAPDLIRSASGPSVRVIKQAPSYVPAHFEYYTTFNSDNRPKYNNKPNPSVFKPVVQTANFRPLQFNYEPVKPAPPSYPVYQGPSSQQQHYSSQSQQSNGGDYGEPHEAVTSQTYKQNDGVLYTDGSYDLQTNFGQGGGQIVYHAPVTVVKRPEVSTESNSYRDEEETFQIQKPKQTTTNRPATVSYHFEQEQPAAEKFQIFVEDEAQPTQNQPIRNAPVRNSPVRKAPPRREPVRNQETTTARVRPTSSGIKQQQDPSKARPLRTRGQSRFKTSDADFEGDTPVRSRPFKSAGATSDISPDDNYPPGVIIKSQSQSQSTPKKRKLVRKSKEQRPSADDSQRREDQDVNPTRNAILWASQWVPIFRNFDNEWETSNQEPKMQSLADRNDVIDRSDVGVEKQQRPYQELVLRIPNIPGSMLRRQKLYLSSR